MPTPLGLRAIISIDRSLSLSFAFENAEDKIPLPDRGRFLQTMEKEYKSCRIIHLYNGLYQPDPENSERYYQNELVSLRRDEMEEAAKQFINAKDGAELSPKPGISYDITLLYGVR